MDRLSAPLRALVALVHPRIDAEGLTVASTALREAGDLAALAGLAAAHGVVPLVTRTLHDLAPSTGGPSLAAARAVFDPPTRELAAEALAAVPTLRGIVGALGAAGIEAMAWKGPMLALQAWGDVAARSFTDLDIVVRPADRHRARVALRASGWRSRHEMGDDAEDVIFASQRAYELARDDEALLVELHWAFGARRYAGYAPVEEVLARAVTVEMAGLAVRVPATPDALMLQAVHATKHGWSTLEDVVVFARLARVPGATRTAEALAAAHGASLPFALGLALVARLFGAADGQAERHTTASPLAARARMLADQVLERWVAGETAWRSTLRWDFAWTEGLWPRARLLARSAFDPTMQEWNAVRLPASLGALYRVIRPARLAARGIARGLRPDVRR